MALKQILNKFAERTTIHGIPKAIRSTSLHGKMFWSCVFVAAAVMFSVQFITLLKKYYAFPKKVTIEVVPLAVPFPSISLCNMRNLDTAVLNELNLIFKETDIAEQWRNVSTDPFIHQYMKTVAKYYKMFILPTIPFSVFQTILSRSTLATNMNRSLVVNAGVSFDEFVVTCRFGGRECNRERHFKQFFDSYYYNCFTYESSQVETGSTIMAEGLENGWSSTIFTGGGMLDKNEIIRIIPGSHEYLSPMSSSEGVRVVIHPPNTKPYPHAEGFDVPPGYSVSFGVKTRQNIRVRAPHGNCSDKNPFSPDSSQQYRLLSCQKMCLQSQIVQYCGCKDIALPGGDQYPDKKYCTDDYDVPQECIYRATNTCLSTLFKLYERIVCAKESKMTLMQNASIIQDCGCFPPCNEISYDVTYSLSRWPAMSFDGEQAYIDIVAEANYTSRFNKSHLQEKFKSIKTYLNESNRHRAMLDFVRLNVYLAESDVLKTEETEDYTQSQLLSDIGGQLGLWVGISVISLAEALELLVDIMRHICRDWGRRRSPTVERKLCPFCLTEMNGHVHQQSNGRIPKSKCKFSIVRECPEPETLPQEMV